MGMLPTVGADEWAKEVGKAKSHTAWVQRNEQYIKHDPHLIYDVCPGT